MAKTILNDASVTVNGVDLSDHVSQVAIEQAHDEVDVTGMGASAKEILLGIQDASITVTFFQDFAAGEVDATLNGLVGSNTPFNVVVKPTDAAVSATNPSYTMSSVLPQYQPVSGSVGEASTTEVTFRNASQSGITRATA